MFTIVLDKHTESRTNCGTLEPPPCRWGLWVVAGRSITRNFHYTCKHQLACVNCGRVEQFRVEPATCPEFRPPPTDVDLLNCVRCGCKRVEHSIGQHGRCRIHGTCPHFTWEDL